jgi:hypothetical protein
MRKWRILLSFLSLLGMPLQAKAEVLLEAVYSTGETSQSQYNGCITLKNASDQAISSWKADFDIPQGQSINYLTNNARYAIANSIQGGNVNANKQHVTIMSKELTHPLQPNESLSVRFQMHNPSELKGELTNLYATGHEQSLDTILEDTQIPLNATYVITNSWTTGYQITVTVANPSTTQVNSWSNSFSLPDGQQISSFWNCVYQATGQQISVSNPTWTDGGIIGASGSTTYGMVIANPNETAMQLNNLQALGSASQTPPAPPLPNAPTLNAIVVKQTIPNTYTLSWKSVKNATSYTLQQDVSSSFSNPVVVASGATLSQTIRSQPNGTYYYRVFASNITGSSPFSNIENVVINVKPTKLTAPVLNAISNPSGTNEYLISWNSVQKAQGYTLQESTSSDFTNAVTVYNGTETSFQAFGKALGTYYYRVNAFATNSTSPESNVESVAVTNVPPSSGIEHSVWYIDWTSWFTGPPYIIPKSNDVLNVFVGSLMFDASGNPTIGEFGNLTSPQLTEFTAYCAAQQPPVRVKASIGGGGGSYDRCWDLLTESNVPAFAQGMVDFCHTYGLIGIDFDYEEFASTAQETLVGALIKNFKTIDPSLQTSLCTNAGFGPNYPWQAVVKSILDAAMISPGNCALDRLYVMSYYNPIQDEQNWVLGWANWVEQNYGFNPARVSVGIDDFDAHAYDPVAFAAWAASNGFSTAHWAFDPAHPVYVGY